MLKRCGSSQTLREYLDKISRLKKIKSSKGEKISLMGEQEETYDMKYAVQILLAKFEKMREKILEIGKQSQQYYQLVNLISEFDHLLRGLTQKIQDNKNNNFLKPEENSPKSPKMRMKSPPSLKYEASAAFQIRQIKQKISEHLYESSLKPSTLIKEIPSLVSTRSKDASSELAQTHENPEFDPLDKKKEGLKLNLDNISSKRFFFKGKIPKMDSIGSTQMQSHLGATLQIPIKN